MLVWRGGSCWFAYPLKKIDLINFLSAVFSPYFSICPQYQEVEFVFKTGDAVCSHHVCRPVFSYWTTSPLSQQIRRGPPVFCCNNYPRNLVLKHIVTLAHIANVAMVAGFARPPSRGVATGENVGVVVRCRPALPFELDKEYWRAVNVEDAQQVAVNMAAGRFSQAVREQDDDDAGGPSGGLQGLQRDSDTPTAPWPSKRYHEYQLSAKPEQKLEIVHGISHFLLGGVILAKNGLYVQQKEGGAGGVGNPVPSSKNCGGGLLLFLRKRRTLRFGALFVPTVRARGSPFPFRPGLRRDLVAAGYLF